MFKNLIKPLSIILSIVVITAGIFYATHQVNANSIIVNSNLDTVADDGFCTLREAIEKANDTTTGDPHGFVSPGECGSGDPTGSDTITFANAMTITLSGDLPTITSPVVIDGVSGIPGLSCGDLPGGTPHNLGVEIDASITGNGFVFDNNSDNSRIAGIMLTNTNGPTQLFGEAIRISSSDNFELSCSYIGTDMAGQNKFFGGILAIENSNNSIVHGNIINGNSGINYSGTLSGSVITGNFFRLDPTGSSILNTYSDINSGNISSGDLSGAVTISNVTIGGTTPDLRNVFSHIRIGFNQVSNLNIIGNYFGTDRTGMSLTGVSDSGWIAIIDPSTDVTIGGPNPGEGNLFAGANGAAIAIQDFSGTYSQVQNTVIQGNLFGTDATGNTQLGIGYDSIQVSQVDDVTIGGYNPGEGNVFGGTTAFQPGSIAAVSVHNLNIIGNNFGVGLDGSTPLPGPPATGMYIIGDSNGMITKNNIQNYTFPGIAIIDQLNIPAPYLFANGTPHMAIVDNKIYNNGGLGIELTTDYDGDIMPDTLGPNLNDISDLDSGPNNNLNYPVIHSITESPAGTLNLSYYLDVPAGSYRVEFYKNPTAGLDSSYHGEGEVLAYVDTFTSTGTMGTKTISLPGTLTDILTGTATQCTDSTCTAFVRTSEFGPTVPITAGGGSGAGLDFGDVTTTQTTALNNGAYHILNTNYLGSCIDADTGTAQNTLATADDTTAPTDPSAIVGTCTTPNDDEDGVTFDKGEYTIGDTAVLDITASAPGIINVWVDTNTNGSFLDAGEQVITNTAVVAGSNTMTGFTVPAANGTYPLRVRYTSSSNAIYQETPGVASPRGEALDGEVEDYNIQVGPVVPPPSGGGGGGSGGSSLDLCLNLPNTQTTVPSGYAKVPVDPLTPGVCTTSVAIDRCPNISGIQQTIPSGYEQKADGHCYTTTKPVSPKEQKPYTIKIYPLSETGVTPPPTSDQCPYFNKYLRLGRKNDTTEVLKWQNFLNTHLKENLKLTGIYDTETVNAVKRFQETYRADVLTPWKLKSPTGWTYKTTRMKANQIVGCLEKPVFLEIPKITWVLPAL